MFLEVLVARFPSFTTHSECLPMVSVRPGCIGIGELLREC